MRKKILVVDDEIGIQMLLNHYLKTEYDVFIKSDGMEAMEWLEEGNHPDLIIHDLYMPNMDGFELLTNLKASTFFKTIPTITLSSSLDENDRKTCIHLGCSEFITKPFNPKDIVFRIQNII